MIRVTSNSRVAQKALQSVVKKLPFAAAAAINATRKQAETAQQRAMGGRFTLRDPGFAIRNIRTRRGEFATPRRPEAILRVEGPGQTTQKSVFTKHEGGGPISATRAFPFAVPSSQLRPDRLSKVPKALYPKNLRLVARRDIVGTMAAQTHTTRRGVKQWRGKRRTFILDPAEHFGVKTWGVYQRTGPGRRDVRLLWTLRERLRLRPRLRFVETVRGVVTSRWQENFRKAYEAEIRNGIARVK